MIAASKKVEFELHGALPVPAGSPARKLASVRAHPGSRPVALPLFPQSTLVFGVPRSRRDHAIVQRPVPSSIVLPVHAASALRFEDHSNTGLLACASNNLGQPIQGDGE